jgi:hypothetical protein
MTNQAIAWMRFQQSMTPDRPFYMYFATGATHAPHHVPKEWIAKYKGKFDAGWDKLREETLARQLKLGVVPAGTKLTTRPPEIPAWDSLSADQKRLFARQMETFAGFAEHTDHEIGRLVDAIRDMGELDNTLVFYIVGDNGSSAEGGPDGTYNEMLALNGIISDISSQLPHIDEWGGPNTFPHFAVGWAHAGNTPFQWTKQVASHFGGTRNPMIIHWPDRIKAKGEVRSQFHHVIDVAPTVLEAAGLPWGFRYLPGCRCCCSRWLAAEYARSALKNGLKLQKELGINPYKFGMVGSTDAHTGLSAVGEDNFFGKTTSNEPSATRAEHPFVKVEKAVIMGWETTASGYAAVWATENTREAIFDAMQRRETYATTGPRMAVRFFAGWDFDETDAQTRNPAVIGYRKGVPMGGELVGHAASVRQKSGQADSPPHASPTFLVAALKDPIGANLDRIQLIKGWLDAKGELHEKVYDLAWSGSRRPGHDGKLPPVGNTVDVANATWTNTIGASELIGVGKDTDFDAAQPAFYYVRVIEIPTPRWTAYDAKYFGVRMPKEIPMTTQERAYTSPIWYTPAKK